MRNKVKSKAAANKEAITNFCDRFLLYPSTRKQLGNHPRSLIRNIPTKHWLPSPPIPILGVRLVSFFAMQQCMHPGRIAILALLRLFMRGIPIAMRGMPKRPQCMSFHFV